MRLVNDSDRLPKVQPSSCEKKLPAKDTGNSNQHSVCKALAISVNQCRQIGAWLQLYGNATSNCRGIEEDMYRLMKLNNGEVVRPSKEDEKPAEKKLSFTSSSDIKTQTIEQTSRITPKQREILVETFSKMEEDLVRHGLKMLVKMFSEFPRYKQIWPQFRAIPDSSLMHAVELKRHASVYMTGLHSIIHSMDNTDRLAEQLNRIARAHIKWNIHRSHITNMLGAVLETVAEANGNQMNKETKEAWTELYHVIADLIEIYRNQSQNVQLLSYA